MTNWHQILRFAIRLKWKNLVLATLVALAFLLGVGVRGYASETLRMLHTSPLISNVEPLHFQLAVISLLTLLNLGLVAVSIYGVMAYTVTQRTPEIELRLAAGARQSEVLRLVLWHGLKLAMQGSLIGLGVAVLFARWLKIIMHGVEASDPFTFAGVAFVLSIVTFTTSIPVRRTPKLEPLAVRYD